MATFAVILTEPNDALVRRLTEQHPKPNHYELAENVYLVTGDLLVDTLIEELGFYEDDAPVGVVLRLDGSYSGRAHRPVWEWLERATEVRV